MIQQSKISSTATGETVTNKQLLFLAALINIVMMFLIVHKQNKIIKYLYELQQLQEHRNELLEQKKELTLTWHKLTQLSTIEAHAKNNLNLRSMTLKDIHHLEKENQAVSPKEAHAATPQ